MPSQRERERESRGEKGSFGREGIPDIASVARQLGTRHAEFRFLFEPRLGSAISVRHTLRARASN